MSEDKYPDEVEKALLKDIRIAVQDGDNDLAQELSTTLKDYRRYFKS